jgi:hypothetical protein
MALDGFAARWRGRVIFTHPPGFRWGASWRKPAEPSRLAKPAVDYQAFHKPVNQRPRSL